MARDAALRLYRCVLKTEWPGFIGVAVEAKLVLCGGSTQLMREEAAMRVVAVAAYEQAFIHFVMKRPREFRLHLQMAGITKLRLSLGEQLAYFLRMVDGMAVRTTNVVFQVLRAHEVGMLLAKLMARHASL